MKKLTLALLVSLLISCSSSSTEPESGDTYPFTNQTWTVESGEFARWDGVRSKAKAFKDSTETDSSQTDSTATDTTFIDRPHKYGLEIQKGSIDSTFELQFVDSTYWKGNAAEYAFVDSLFGRYRQTVYTEYYDGYANIDIVYPFTCGTEKTPVDTLDVVYAPYDNPEDTVDYKRISIDGALETVNHIMCES